MTIAPRFCLAEVKVTAEDVTAEGAPLYRYATGIATDADRVLTARHVLGTDPKRVEVRFPRLSADTWHLATVLWPEGETARFFELSDGVPDAMVLQVTEPPKGLGVVLSDVPPRPAEDWWSEALPRGGLRDSAGRLIPTPLNGTVKQPALKAVSGWEALHLNVKGEPDERKEWRGASGAPVFVHGQLRGMISAVPESWSESLVAVSLVELFEQPGLAQALGLDDQRKRRRACHRETVTARLRAVLEPAAATRKALVSVLDGAQLTCRDDPGELLETLLGLELGPFAAICNLAHAALMAEKDTAAAQAIVQLLQQLGPLLVEAGLVEQVFRHGASAVLQLPVVTPTLIEFVMAAADQRPLYFARPKRRGELARGDKELSRSGVETGKSKDAQVDQIRDHLLNQYVDKWLIDRETSGLPPGERRRPPLDNLLGNALAWMADPLETAQPFRHFFVYLQTDTLARDVAEALHERFRDIRAIALGSQGTVTKEQRLSSVLVELLLNGLPDERP